MTNLTVVPVTPEPGVGVTYHSWCGIVPGTILRAGREVFWFRVDRDFPGAEQLTEAFLGWTNRAILYDGVWRVDHEMLRVEVGFRRAGPRASPEQTEAGLLAARVEACEPSLLKRRWYPMSYMAIPGVLAKADALLAKLEAYEGPERARVTALHARFARLRARFRNVGGGLTSVEDEFRVGGRDGDR
jgi:hypothetical protein